MTLVKFYRHRTNGAVEVKLVRTLRKKRALWPPNYPKARRARRPPTVPEAERSMADAGWTRKRLKPLMPTASGIV